jgi:hypothetical protein
VIQNRNRSETEDNPISAPHGNLMIKPSFLLKVRTLFPDAPDVRVTARKSLGIWLSFPGTLRPSSWLAWHELAPCKFANRGGASR